MTDLYPAIEPYRTHRLDAGAGHELHVEECGREDGVPVLFLHGGPGIGCEPVHRRFFDPAVYRVILFDQRGAGRSTPHASLEDNHTGALLEDIEMIRERLGVDRWLVFGGSWGSTLALVYAETHPDRVLGLVLRGIFLCRPEDIRWFYHAGAHRLLPDHWESLIAPIPEEERGDLVAAYYRRLTGPDEDERLRLARTWALWEAHAATLRPNAQVLAHFENPAVALSMARIECHYFAHDCFLAPDQILRDAHRLTDIPGVLVHGRYDLVCPVDQAYHLHRAWPDAELHIAPEAGHAAGEPGIRERLVQATDEFAERFA